MAKPLNIPVKALHHTLLSMLMLSAVPVSATNYIFPGSLPSGCSGSNGAYSCNDLTLAYGDTIAIASPKPATITVNGAMTTNTSTINSGGSASDLNLVVTGVLTANYLANIKANITVGSIIDSNGSVNLGGSIATTTGSVTLNFQTTVAGSITSTTGDISIGNSGVVSGNISSTSGLVNVGYAAHVNGNVTTSGEISLAQNAVVTGTITGSSGNISIGYAATATGAVTSSSGSISFGQSSTASACVKSTSSAAITLGYQASINSVCCGSTCSTSCVTNNTTYAMPSQCAVVNPTPLAYYRMDEPSWNGTANEVTDFYGNYSGTAETLTSTRPTTSSTSPPISGDPGTCRYGRFTRSSKNYVALSSSFPNLGSDGNAFSITAWIKTTDHTQSGQRILIDDEQNSSGYGFSVGDGGTGMLRFFSRGTPSALILDTANVIADNIWYFVAAVIDVPNKTKTIYVYNTAGSVLANVSMSWTETSFGSDSGIPSIGGETNSATENNTSFGFSGRIDELRVYQSALTSTQLSEIRQSTHACSSVSTGATASNFNCIESNASAASGHLFTKLSGTPFSFDVVALKSDATVETAFAGSNNKNVTVELVDGSGSTACASRTVISPAVSQTLAFSAADSGRKAITAFTVDKAYPDLRCRVSDTNQSPAIIGCSTDNFAVRPSGFSVTSDVNADASGLSTTATPAVKAGANFTLTAASGTAGYSYSPLIDSTKLSSHSGAIQNGTIAGSFSSVNSATGTASGSTFTYSEAGYFQFAAYGIYDDSFTSVDSAANDCSNGFSNVSVNGKYGCKFGNTATTGYFGRFIPDHFALIPGLSAPACGTTFTYFGQDGFNTSFTLTAQNAANTTTQNYTSGYAKLDLSDWTNFNFTSPGLPSGSILSASATAPSGSWSIGMAAVTAKHQINRPTALTGQISATVYAAPVDSDGVTMASTQVSPATPLRYGRISLGNAYGSELLDLPVPMQAEYYNGSSFIANSDDSCSVSTISITDPDSTDSLVPADSCIWDDSATSGSFKCATTAPAGTSYREESSLVSGSFNLYFKSPAKTGSLNVSASVASWLQFDWQGTGNTDPSARATFGIFKGSDKHIYLREVY